MSIKPLLTSHKDDWETPQELFDELHEQLNFTLDPAAGHTNAKCDKYYTKEEDGLIQSRCDEVVFCNPPYGREISKWVEKAFKESIKGTKIVLLITSRTETEYWHKYIFNSNQANIYFIKKRLRFSNAPNVAPFPSALIAFNCKINPIDYCEMVEIEVIL